MDKKGFISGPVLQIGAMYFLEETPLYIFNILSLYYESISPLIAKIQMIDTLPDNIYLAFSISLDLSTEIFSFDFLFSFSYFILSYFSYLYLFYFSYFSLWA